MGLLRRIVLVAMAAGVIVAVTTGAAGSSADPSPGCMTMKQFREHSGLVWSADRWQRGRPGHTAIRAQRRALRCASPGDRQAMQARWQRDKRRYNKKRRFCYSGPKIEGRVSVYSGGTTGDGIHNASEPGIAIRDTSTYGDYYRVHVQGSGTAMLMHFDYGPATYTGRAIDITLAGAAKLGGVTTDNWGIAKMIPGSCM